MPDIAPTVTAFDTHQYRLQIQNIESFAKRIHIDLMDGEFAPTKSPDLERSWWPRTAMADIHLMYQRPADYLDKILALKPHMVIIHNEADVHHMDFAARLHNAGIKAGLAVLRETPIDYAYQIMHSFDHVLIFSGDLGKHGGEADLELLKKVAAVRIHHPDAEIGWDGGINDQNVKKLADNGVDVLNIGGFIQDSPNPKASFEAILSALK